MSAMILAEARLLWWEGVVLWYNQSDYLEAMRVWEHAVALLEIGSPGIDNYIDDDDDDPLEKWLLERKVDRMTATNGENYSVADSDSISRAAASASQCADIRRPYSLGQEFAPLLLFLSGCYLDSTQIHKARTCLTRCLQLLLGDSDQDHSAASGCVMGNSRKYATRNIIAKNAIQEYLSSYQEDISLPEPWRRSRQLLDLACEADLRLPDNTKFPRQNPWQRPGFMYPMPVLGCDDGDAVTASAVYAESKHPTWCRSLEDSWESILAEFQQLYYGSSSSSKNRQQQHRWPRVGAATHRGGAGQHDGSVIQTGDWREWVLLGSSSQGLETSTAAPVTLQLLHKHCFGEAAELAAAGGGEVIFSVLAPHTRIKPHCGSTNLRLTAHLGLVIPNEQSCYIRVAGEKLLWHPGKILVFDDSYEHEVINDTDQLRAVLLIRFWHPNLPAAERQFALQQALVAKQHDEESRFNPPLPIEHRALYDRSMRVEESPYGTCASCSRNGYESIRVQSIDDAQFACICGRPIDFSNNI
jgi:hypothetical protein